MYLDEARGAIDRALADILDVGLEGAPGEVAEPIRYAVLAPGKRVRPLLVLAAHAATVDPRVGGGAARDPGVAHAAGRPAGVVVAPAADPGPAANRGPAANPGPGFAAAAADEPDPALLRLACGVELIHAYSLIHDDLPCMDDDDLRRGRPTVHIEFGVGRAILAGGALMPLAVELVGRAALDLGLDRPTAARLISILMAASGGGGMVGGQQLDLAAEGREIDVAELERIHRGKTAQLIEAACLMGAIAAGTDEDAVARVGRYGLGLGLAFQVVDDILDVTGSLQSMGKAGGRDAVLGKATFPTLVGVAGARQRARDLVAGALSEVEGLPGAARLERVASLVIERDR